MDMNFAWTNTQQQQLAHYFFLNQIKLVAGFNQGVGQDWILTWRPRWSSRGNEGETSIQFLVGIDWGLRSLLAVSLGLPSVLCHVSLSIGQLTAWPLAPQPKGESLLGQRIWDPSKWCPIAFAILWWLESSRRPRLHSRGGNFSRAWIPGDRIIWDSFRICQIIRADGKAHWTWQCSPIHHK